MDTFKQRYPYEYAKFVEDPGGIGLDNVAPESDLRMFEQAYRDFGPWLVGEAQADFNALVKSSTIASLFAPVVAQFPALQTMLSGYDVLTMRSLWHVSSETPSIIAKQGPQYINQDTYERVMSYRYVDR